MHSSDLTPDEVEVLRSRIDSHEDWLMLRVLDYARRQQYTRYTSTLEEAWRISVRGLSRSILVALAESPSLPDFGPEDEFLTDRIGAFAREEARRHRERGVDLKMFLGLMKYYRQAYVDLLTEADWDRTVEQRTGLFVNRVFDRIEIGFCAEWANLSCDETVRQLQATNRFMTNEKNRYLTIFESLPVPVFLLTLEQKISGLNLAAAELIRGNASPGQEYYESGLSPAELPSWIRTELASFLEGNEERRTVEKEVPAQSKGEYRELSFSKILDVSGKYEGTLLIVKNITDRKRVEAAAMKSSRIEVTSRLAGGIAHDFNNLMQAVLGNAELLADDLRNDAQSQELLHGIIKSAERGGSLAQQMLAYAQGGRYQARSIGLNQVVEENVRLQIRCCPPDIRILRDLSCDLKNVIADKSQMMQVVMNLCLNAVEAITGTGEVTISTKNVRVGENDPEFPDLRPGEYVRLSVRDTGCGMSSEVQERMFEPFFTTKFQGRGLGLSAVYGIITNHGGHITVRSQIGQGSMFSIFLEAVSGEKMAAAPEKVLLTGKETILAIDDDSVVLAVIQRGLRRLGYHVLTATNGREAVDLVHEWTEGIDLAILDMEMPVMNGRQAFPELMSARPDMKLIICSGYDFSEAVEELLRAGASLYLRKPVSIDVLAAEIRKILDSGDSGDKKATFSSSFP